MHDGTAEPLRVSPPEAVAYLLELFAQLREDLELHAHAEERVLYSALKETEGVQELVEEALDDHRHYRKYGFCSPNSCNFNG